MKEDKNIKNNSTKYNLETLNIMLKYKLLSYDNANKLYKDGFFKNLKGSDKIIEKYHVTKEELREVLPDFRKNVCVVLDNDVEIPTRLLKDSQMK